MYIVNSKRPHSCEKLSGYLILHMRCSVLEVNAEDLNTCKPFAGLGPPTAFYMLSDL